MPSCRGGWRGTVSAADVEEVFAVRTRFHVQVSIRILVNAFIIICQFLISFYHLIQLSLIFVPERVLIREIYFRHVLYISLLQNFVSIVKTRT